MFTFLFEDQRNKRDSHSMFVLYQRLQRRRRRRCRRWFSQRRRRCRRRRRRLLKNKHIATQFKLNRALEEAKSVVVVVGSTKDFNKSFCNRKTTKQEENPQKLFKRQTRTNGLDYFQNYSR